jgi:HSP90 family molecular chaperone
VHKVQVSKRLSDSPAIVVGQMSSGLRQVMGMMDRQNADQLDKNLTMEINPNHEIIVKLN